VLAVHLGGWACTMVSTAVVVKALLPRTAAAPRPADMGPVARAEAELETAEAAVQRALMGSYGPYQGATDRGVQGARLTPLGLFLKTPGASSYAPPCRLYGVFLVPSYPLKPLG
jgi:hypothetical protein